MRPKPCKDCGFVADRLDDEIDKLRTELKETGAELGAVLEFLMNQEGWELWREEGFLGPEQAKISAKNARVLREFLNKTDRGRTYLLQVKARCDRLKTAMSKAVPEVKKSLARWNYKDEPALLEAIHLLENAVARDTRENKG